MQGPILAVEVGKEIPVCADAEKTAWNILEALKTPLGSRPCLPNFGSKLHLLKFELLTDFFLDLCKIYINDCVQSSVQGVIVKDIKVEKKGDKAVQFNILFMDERSLLLGTTSLIFDNGIWKG